jgi:hypothetical protein
LYVHSKLYRDGDVPPLQRDALQLTLGGRYTVSPRNSIGFGFQEDLVTESSPDVSFHLDWSWR